MYPLCIFDPFLQGEGELSPAGVLYALRFLAAFTSVSRLLTLAAAGAGTGKAKAAAPRTSLLQLSRKEGILNVVSSILFPAVSKFVVFSKRGSPSSRPTLRYINATE